MHAELAKRSGFSVPESTQHLISAQEKAKEHRLSAQPKGEFKLDRVVY